MTGRGRLVIATAAALMLAGCAMSHDTLWPGPDWQTSGIPGGPLATSADEPDTAPADAAGTRVPRERTRRGSSTPPDALFPNPTEPRRPPPASAGTPTPTPLVEPRNDALAPRDPNAPYSADRYGYQRQGDTLIGPRGEVYNRVGSSLIGPGGRPCSVVGNAVMCN